MYIRIQVIKKNKGILKNTSVPINMENVPTHYIGHFPEWMLTILTVFFQKKIVIQHDDVHIFPS